jgi:hypothetical protein
MSYLPQNMVELTSRGDSVFAYPGLMATGVMAAVAAWNVSRNMNETAMSDAAPASVEARTQETDRSTVWHSIIAGQPVLMKGAVIAGDFISCNVLAFNRQSCNPPETVSARGDMMEDFI